MSYTAVYEERDGWFLGWVEEVPGVNTQGKSLAEAKENLKEALKMVVEANRDLLRQERSDSDAIRERIEL